MMQFHRAIAAATLCWALLASGGAYAFETTSIGGTNADGSAKYQDPDEVSAAAAPAASSPFGNFSVQTGSDADASSSSSTNWLSGPAGSGFGFSGSQSSSTQPATPFNTPLLRERN